MTPRPPTLDIANGPVRNTVLASNFIVASWVVKNSQNLLIGEFCLIVFLSARHFLRVCSRPILVSANNLFWMFSGPVIVARTAASLHNSVHGVVFMSAEKQMGYFKAWPRVATMKNAHTVWNRSERMLPSDSVNSAEFTVYACPTVPSSTYFSCPNTASSGRHEVTAREKVRLNLFDRARFWTHDVSTKTVEGSRVSPVVAGRRFETLVPAGGL